MDTDTPYYHEIFSELTRYLNEYGALGVILVDCSSLQKVEKCHGKGIFADIKESLIGLIEGFKGSHIKWDDMVAQNYPDKDELLIFLSFKRSERQFRSSHISGLVERIAKAMNTDLTKNFSDIIQMSKVYAGYGIVLQNKLFTPEKLVSRLISDAKKMADHYNYIDTTANVEKIQELIFQKKITTVYQPIVDLNTSSIIGYEGLTRGAKGTGYENSSNLFQDAHDANLVTELDNLCRKETFTKTSELSDDLKIFLNCVPGCITDSAAKEAYLDELLEETRLTSKSVILELTEAEAIESFDVFKEALMYYSQLGFAITVDNTGAGYASLETLMELKPDYVKLDISMIRDIHNIPIKQQMVTALTNICNILGATVIAEGVESVEENNKIQELGIKLGQGFYYAKPDFPFPQIKK